MLPKYTYFKLHDPAAYKYNSTLEYRRDLVKRQITLYKNNIHSLNLESQKIRDKLESSITPAQLHELDNRLSVIINKSDYDHKLTLQKKLNNLFKGHLLIPNNIDKFINLSDCNLTPQQKDFLNLRPNCHLFQGYTSINKKTEIEILYQNILKLRDNKVISVKPEFRDLLKAEAIKNRYNKKQPTLLTHQLKTAAKELRNHPNITIKKADKTNIFVVLNKTDYHSKLQNILDDHTKFKKLNKNPTNQLKSKINKLITANNAELNSIKLPKIIGDYKPGYLYGTVKIHKPNHPLRPIISQIPTPIYQLTKTIKQLISPYLPSKYNIKSTHELIQVLHTIKPNNGILASLDIENLFTNVPVNETIDIIINNIYNNPSLPPLKINSNILRKLLLTCTTEVPFYDHLGNIYVQTDGVSMGSVLGPIFSDFYMSDLENRIFNSTKKPPIYLRYVDDILILTNNINEINILQDTFQNNSVLNFTHELNKNNKISFLDVLIDANNNNNFTTSTYKKPSSNNSCTLNFKSECPFRYKKAIIHNLISRAKLISSSKTIFYKELENIKQALINNGFPNYIVDEQIKRMIKNVNQQNKQCTTPSSQQTYIKLFYRN